MAPMMKHLIESATAMAMRTTPLTRENAESFLGEFSLDFLFTAFQSGSLEEEDVQTAARALSKVFAAVDLVGMLPKLMQYSIAALEAEHESVRHLGLEQLARLSQMEHNDSGIASEALFKAMQDEDTGMGAAAVKALLECFTRDAIVQLGRHKDTLLELLRHRDAVIQMRALELLLSIASVSPEARIAVEREGLLDVGMSPLLSFDDPLGCLACWDLFAQLLLLLSTESQNMSSDIVSVVSGWLIPRIGHVVQSLPALDRSLQIGIVKIVCSIVGQTVTSGEDSKNAFRQVVSSLLQRLNEDGHDQEWLEIGLDCFGQLGRRALGSEILIMNWPEVLTSLTSKAFGDRVQLSVRMTALQSLATIADSSGNELLIQQAEDRLKEAVCSNHEFEGLPDIIVWKLMNSGPLELRDSVYRLMTALVKRLWFLSVLCQNTELLDHISNSRSEIHAELSKSRYACLEALVTTLQNIDGARDVDSLGAEELMSLRSLLPQLERSLESGPFGRGVGAASSVPVVGTEFR